MRYIKCIDPGYPQCKFLVNRHDKVSINTEYIYYVFITNVNRVVSTGLILNDYVRK